MCASSHLIMATHLNASGSGLVAALSVAGACRWAGRRRPLAGRLRTPVPRELRRMARADGWLRGIFPADLARVRRAAAGTTGLRFGRPVDYRLVTEPAGVVWVRHWFAAGPGGGLHGVVRIIDEERRLEAECIRVCERERHTIGQELHDDLCQLLAGVAAMLQGLSATLPTADPAARRTLADLLTLLSSGMDRARGLAHGLVLLRVAHLDCGAAFRDLARESGRRFGIPVVLHLSRPLPAHDAEQIGQLYRIGQEAIGNAVRHGAASKLALRLQTRGRRMRLTVRDDGSGLLPVAQRIEGLGLHIMGYRAATFGGSVVVAPARPRGTIVTVDYECRPPGPTSRSTRRTT